MRRYSDDLDRDYLLRCLRGEITSDGGYRVIAVARHLFRTGQLHDRELVAALHVGDNAHLDDARRWTVRADP